MPRAATKALPSTPAPAAAARAVKATAQEADEAPVTKDKTPVTYSRKKKNPAASEAAAAAAPVTGIHHQSKFEAVSAVCREQASSSLACQL